MNKDDDYFDQNDKYPKVGLLNEDIVKDDFANASKKNAGNKIHQIELSEYQPLADDYDQNGTKPGILLHLKELIKFHSFQPSRQPKRNIRGKEK